MHHETVQITESVRFAFHLVALSYCSLRVIALSRCFCAAEPLAATFLNSVSEWKSKLTGNTAEDKLMVLLLVRCSSITRQRGSDSVRGLHRPASRADSRPVELIKQYLVVRNKSVAERQCRLSQGHVTGAWLTLQLRFALRVPPHPQHRRTWGGTKQQREDKCHEAQGGYGSPVSPSRCEPVRRRVNTTSRLFSLQINT